MKPLLVVKIPLTLLFWALPLTFLPEKVFSLFGPTPQPILFVRLLGVAYLSLCAGYFWGLRRLKKGEKIDGIVWMGILSNGGACLTLFLYRLSGGWAGWTALGQAYLWLSLILTAGITLAMTASVSIDD